MFSRPFRRSAVVLLLVASLGFAACGGSDDEPADAPSDAGASDSGGSESGGDSGGEAAATVDLKAVTFEPAEVTIKVGETVEWKWEGGVQHNVNGGDAFKSELQNKGEFAYTFEKAGTFKYKCDVHANMEGTVTVS